MDEEHFIEVAVALPVEGTFVYRLPDALAGDYQPGARVLVPFGRRKLTGYILGPGKPPKDVKVKEIIDILDEKPSFPKVLLNDLRWLSDYYLSPLGEVLKGALPAGINVESAAALIISPEGEKALREGDLKPLDAHLLAQIASSSGISRKKLLSTPSREGKPGLGPAKAAIGRLVRNGLAMREDRVGRAPVKPRRWRMAAIAPGLERPVADIAAEMVGRAPVRARLLVYIESAGEAPVAQLGKRFKNASSQVKALEKDGLVVTRSARVWRDPLLGDVPEYEERPPELTPAQSAAFKEVAEAIKSRIFKPFLLHGVTGSGKTEVYLRAIEVALKAGRQALVLAPEIALTPQLVGRFRARFGDDVAVLHSGMGRGQRLDEWSRARDGRVKVAIGARSAIFAPFDNLGVIVVDEEHDGGYKQEEKTPYSARDFALVRGRSMNAAVLLGSATPSMESYHNALKGKYRLLELPERVERRPLPGVEVVDLKTADKGRSQFISAPLEEEIAANFERRRQTILFLNRRGYAPFLMCVQCGHTFGCPSCSVSLTFHQRERRLMCHFCDHREPPPNTCPGCGGKQVKMIGIGTERIEEEIGRILPAARVARMDRDTVAKKGALDKILGALRDGSLDILVGTQMVAKGHDYPGVTLVGVIMAETSLNFPDFRATETTFSLLTQVAGRAGRGADLGKVVVQTYNPENFAIRMALKHDYETFAREEMALRKELDYPPFKRLAALRISGPGPATTREAAQIAGDAARKCGGVRVLGPAPAPWARIKNRYRWQVLIKANGPKAARETARYVLQSTSAQIKSLKATITADIDPLRLL